MATFSLHARRAEEAARNAKLLAKLALEPSTPKLEPAPHRTTRFEFPDPVDLRGIPAVGRGIAGVSPGTRPDGICSR